jgi:YidC/Oxa1 family membrane protein insertase
MVLANIFQPLIDIFGPVLVFFHSIIGGSWGWSIIALTVVVRALLLPLAFKQMHSMQKLQRVAPQMKAIQACSDEHLDSAGDSLPCAERAHQAGNRL